MFLLHRSLCRIILAASTRLHRLSVKNLEFNARGRGPSKLRQWHRIAADNKRRTEMSETRSMLFQPAVTVRPGRYVWRFFHAWARDIAHYFVRRAALKRLREFNDRELRDIGLSRGQIEAAVYGLISHPDRGRLS
jgi:uncharacterized protein YjiS (DUF1127 family)